VIDARREIVETSSIQSPIIPHLGLAASPAHASALLLVPFVEAAYALGLRVEAGLARAGVALSGLADPDALISHALAERLLAAAIACSGERSLGLQAAERLQPLHLDVVESIARGQSTLRSALEQIVRCRALLHDHLESDLNAFGDRVELRIGFGGLASSDAVREFVLAAHLIVARRLSGVPWLAPLEAHFRHARPSDVSLHERIFCAPLHFDSSRDALLFSSAALEVPVLSADSELERAMALSAPQPLALRRDGLSLVERVREIVRQTLTTRDFGARSTARRLEMSLRSLNRHLLGNGTSYRAVVDEVRRNLALRALASTDLSIREIGGLIGFTTGPAFHRAFRRWTGATASSYRNDPNRLHDLRRSRLGSPDANVISCERTYGVRRPAARRSR
jgi:AraC-like DNA-binding protein